MECCKKEKKTIRSEEDKNKINNRINRIIGQLNAIKGMIEKDTYCEDIIIQLLAIEKSTHSLSTFMLEKHLSSCVKKAIENKDDTIVEEITTLFKRYE
ncbi:MAG: metal-sensitive transcriptional regulator [Bacilli bacterium]